MEKKIILDNKEITYKLQKSRRSRRLRLSVHHNGSIAVSAPVAIGDGVIDRFLRLKSRWIFEKIAYFKQFKFEPVKRLGRRDYQKYKEIALNLVEQRISHFNKVYNYSIGRIAIKNQKTRWGSCSKDRNLNFNYKISLLPEKVADYVVVHELCHLKEFNHSKKFWSLVGKTISNHPELKRELKKNSLRFSN